MTSVQLNDELVARVQEYIAANGSRMSVDQACEQLIVHGLSAQHRVDFQAPNEDEVKQRLQALGYLD